jgi:hypothetical protein
MPAHVRFHPHHMLNTRHAQRRLNAYDPSICEAQNTLHMSHAERQCHEDASKAMAEKAKPAQCLPNTRHLR